MSIEKKLVFMVEEDHDDRFLTSHTLEELGHNVPIKFFSNGTQLFADFVAGTPDLEVK